MENLSSNIANTQSHLNLCRQRFTTSNASAKKIVGAEVTGIHTSLKHSFSKVQQTTSQMRSFLLQIEDTTHAETTVNMAPQISWLSRSLDSIVASLGDAEASADRALICTTEHTYNVLDIGQEMKSASSRLNELQSQVMEMSSKAESALSFSQQILKQTEANVRAKEKEIQAMTCEANNKRSHKSQLEGEISQRNTQIADIERHRSNKKDAVGAGVVLTAIGIIGAPFTAGASLPLAAAGAGLAGYKGVRAKDLKKEANALRSSLHFLTNEISQSDQVIANLEQEKRKLQSLVSRYQDDISSRRLKNCGYQRQICEANYVQKEIVKLKDVAESTASDVKGTNCELQKIKQSLGEFSCLVQDKSTDVSTSAGIVEFIIDMSWSQPLSTNTRRERVFRRRKEIIQQVSETLETVSTQIPLLLPSRKVEFLDFKPWDAAVAPEVGGHDEIPAMLCFEPSEE